MAALISYHRGGSDTAPANSLAAYRAAVEAGAELIEFDVHRTGDGEFICAHDAMDSTGRRWADLGWDEISSSESAPCLVGDVAKLAAGRTGLHVDLKEAGYEQEIVSAVLEWSGSETGSERTPTTYFTSLEDSTVAAISSAFPGCRNALSLGTSVYGLPAHQAAVTRLREVVPFARIRSTGANTVAVHYHLLTPALHSFCKRGGIEIMVWTVNSDNRLQRLLDDPDISVVITDRPQRAHELRDPN